MWKVLDIDLSTRLCLNVTVCAEQVLIELVRHITVSPRNLHAPSDTSTPANKQ